MKYISSIPFRKARNYSDTILCRRPLGEQEPPERNRWARVCASACGHCLLAEPIALLLACAWALDRLCIGIADAMGIVRVETCRYSKRPPRPRASQRYEAQAQRMSIRTSIHMSAHMSMRGTMHTGMGLLCHYPVNTVRWHCDSRAKSMLPHVSLGSLIFG